MYIALLILSFLFQVGDYLTFKRYDTSSGLSNNIVHDIFQDSEGFLWVATENGLNRFDGLSFTTFTSSLSDSLSISHNVVLDVFEDSEGDLWVGTWNGLNRFDRATETFTRYTSIPKYGGYRIGYNDIIIDSEGRFWFPSTAGICLFSPTDHSFKIINSDGTGSSRFMESGEYVIFRDSEEVIWIYNQAANYLAIYDQNEHQLIPTDFAENASLFPSYSTGTIWTGSKFEATLPFPSIRKLNSYAETLTIEKIHEDRQGNLWIGTNNGVFVQHNGSLEIINVSGSQFGTGSLSYFVEQIYEDRWSGIWVGTRNGLFHYNPLKKPFKHIKPEIKDNQDQISNIVMSVEPGESGLWAGTLGSGLYWYDLEKETWTHHRVSTNNEANQVWDVFAHPNQKNSQWLATTYGLYTYQSDSRTTTRVPLPVGSSENPIIFSIISGGPNSIWVAGDHNIYKIDIRSQAILEIINFPPRVSVSTVQDLLLKERHLYISTQGGGLMKYDIENKSFAPLLKQIPSAVLLSEYPIWDIHEDSKQSLWLATGSGLFRLDTILDTLTHIQSQRLNFNYVFFSIAEDSAGFLWLGSDDGLFKFDPESHAFTRFDQSNGLINTEFNRRAVGFSNDGTLWLGGTNGITYFVPSQILTNPFPPVITLTSFTLFDSEGSSPVLYNSKEALSFSWFDNTFEIGFTGITFTNPEQVKYEYILENHDPGWVTAQNNKLARYAKIPPGEYIFKIKASNNDDIWNSAALELPIIIHPPFWQTWWAYLTYLFTVVFGIVLFIRWKTGSLEKDRKKLERKVSERTAELEEQKELAVEAKRKIEAQAEQLKELDEMKSRFFANISHELRTPLTLIDAPLQQVLDENLSNYPKKKLQNKLLGIQRNSKRLSKLINELLDLSRLKENSIEINPKQLNLRTWFKLFVDSYQSLALSRGISFKTSQDFREVQHVMLDVEKFDKITSNLINNALKFTQSGDSVEIGLSLEESILKFTVTDSGAGISKHKLPKIFDRFYKGASGDGNFTNGLGLGLSLSKELTELMNGTISVDSSLGVGSTFELCIPVQVVEKTINSEHEDPQIKQTTRSGSKSALIVEDNSEMREFLVQLLQPDFEIFEAENGRSALQVLKNISPNIIISDLMMPEMDGIELTQQLRSLPNFAHIPILMLTARATDEDRLHSLRIGVDDYLSKPFIPEEVRVRAINLAENHQMRIAFNSEMDSAERSPEEKELLQIQQTIEAQLHNTSLNVISLASELHTSERQLYRKVQRLTGMTPNEYINSIRLSHARKLLLSNKSITINLVGLQVGFKSRSYFSRLFKKAYGLSPGKFQSQK